MSWIRNATRRRSRRKESSAECILFVSRHYSLSVSCLCKGGLRNCILPVVPVQDHIRISNLTGMVIPSVEFLGSVPFAEFASGDARCSPENSVRMATRRSVRDVAYRASTGHPQDIHSIEYRRAGSCSTVLVFPVAGPAGRIRRIDAAGLAFLRRCGRVDGLESQVQAGCYQKSPSSVEKIPQKLSCSVLPSPNGTSTTHSKYPPFATCKNSRNEGGSRSPSKFSIAANCSAVGAGLARSIECVRRTRVFYRRLGWWVSSFSGCSGILAPFACTELVACAHDFG